MRFKWQQRTMEKKVKISIIGLIVVATLTACSSTEPSEETEMVEIEREEISVQPESIQFNKELEQLEVVLTTNLPAETILDVTLFNPEGRYWGSDYDVVVDSEGKVHTEVTPSYDLSPINGEYTVEVEVTVNGDDDDERENINEDLLRDSTLGGYAYDMEDYYVDSEVVEVSTAEEYNSYNYVLNVSSASTVVLSNGYTEEEVAQMEEEKEAETASASDTADDNTTDAESSYESAGSYESGQSEFASATGYDWLEYSFDDKFIAVQTIINAMEASGTTVNADVYWFIDALNGYYFGNDAGASEKIIDIMTLSGIAGGAIQ